MSSLEITFIPSSFISATFKITFMYQFSFTYITDFRYWTTKAHPKTWIIMFKTIPI